MRRTEGIFVSDSWRVIVLRFVCVCIVAMLFSPGAWILLASPSGPSPAAPTWSPVRTELALPVPIVLDGVAPAAASLGWISSLDLCFREAQGPRAGKQQHRTHPFASTQHAVAHGLVQARRHRCAVRKPRRQRRFHARAPGFELGGECIAAGRLGLRGESNIGCPVHYGSLAVRRPSGVRAGRTSATGTATAKCRRRSPYRIGSSGAIGPVTRGPRRAARSALSG